MTFRREEIKVKNTVIQKYRRTAVSDLFAGLRRRLEIDRSSEDRCRPQARWTCRIVKIKLAFHYPKVHRLVIIGTIELRHPFNLLMVFFNEMTLNVYSYTKHATPFRFSNYNIKINGINDSKYFMFTCEKTVACSKGVVLSLPAMAQASFDTPPPTNFNHMIKGRYCIYVHVCTAHLQSRSRAVQNIRQTARNRFRSKFLVLRVKNLN